MTRGLLKAVLLTGVVGAAAMAQAKDFTFHHPSKFRQISKDATAARFGYPGLGVGNVIFANQQLVKDREETYTKVGKLFQGKEIGGEFEARVYFPGQLRHIIAHIKAERSDLEFKLLRTVLELRRPQGGISKAIDVQAKPVDTVRRVDDSVATSDLDSIRLNLMGMNQLKIAQLAGQATVHNPKLGPSIKPGEYAITVDSHLEFRSKTEKVRYWQDGNEIEEPKLYSWVIASGHCAVVAEGGAAGDAKGGSQATPASKGSGLGRLFGGKR